MIDDHGIDMSQTDRVVMNTLNLNARVNQARAAEVAARARRSYQAMKDFGFPELEGAWTSTLRDQRDARWAGQRARCSAAAVRLVDEVLDLREESFYSREFWG